MSKLVKGLIQSEFDTLLTEGKVRDFLVLELKGINGTDNNVVRADLRKKGVRVMVVRNALFRKVLAAKKMDAASSLFAGPCAIAYGGDSIVDAAKSITDWTKKVKAVQVKGAFLEGMVLDVHGAEALAKMPTRRELQAQVVGSVRSCGAKLASAIVGPASMIAGCVKTIADKAEEQAA